MNCKTCGGPLRITRPGEEGICPHCTMAGLFDDPEISPGSEEVDDYDIKREIGRGGDGTVYLGFDTKVGREVAIKLINTDRRIDETTERRFQAESEAIASLDHPHIIPIYANGKMDGRPFYTMKFVTGGSLASRLDEFATPDTAAALMIKVARAVHHAHERGILHRDLKPSNILLDENLEPYISDFGLAKRYEENNDLTLTGAVMGTPSFMSPEQARGDNAQITTTSDVFSLGSILYQILTGKLPFEGTTSHHVLRSVIETQVTFPKGTRHNINKDLETICLKCLEKDSSKRYPSALALAEDLERWQKHLPVQARRVTATERTMRWVRRHPLPAGALALATLSLITGTIVSLALWQRAELSRADSDEARRLSDQAREVAEDNAYFSNIENAISTREDFDFGQAKQLLSAAPPEKRGLEWNLVNGLTSGDQEWTKHLDVPAIRITYDRGSQRTVVLLEERTFHTVDPDNGELRLLGKLPDTPKIAAKYIDLEYPGIRAFSFSPDGKHYLFIDESQVIIASTNTNEIVFSERNWRGGLACWIDSHRVVCAHRSWDGISKLKSGIYVPSAWLYDLRTHQKNNLSPRAWAGPIQRSPDDSLIAIVTRNRTVEVYPANTTFEEKPLHSFTSQKGNIQEISFSPDGRFLAFSGVSSDHHHYIADLQSDKIVFEQVWPTATKFCFSQSFPGTPTLILTGRQPWFTAWQFLNKPSPTPSFDDGHPKSTSYEQGGPFSPPSSLLTRSTKDKRTSFFFGHSAAVNSLVPLPSRRGFITLGQDNTLRRWPPLPAQPNRKSRVLTNLFYYHPTASHNGEYLTYRDKQHRAIIWHRPSDTTIKLPKTQTALAVFNDGRVLSRVDKSGDLICSQFTKKGTLTKLWQQHPGITSGYNHHQIHTSVTPDERFVAVLHPARLLTVDMEKKAGQTIPDQGMTYGTSPGQYTAISDDGRLALITGVKGPNARIYQTNDLAKGYQSLVAHTPHTTRDSAGVFSRDHSLVYVGNNDGRIRVFDTETFEEIPSLGWQAHHSEVTALTLSQDGEILASAGGNKTIFWSTHKAPDQPRRMRLHLSTGSASRNWLQFCADDSLFMHSGTDQPIEIWPAHDLDHAPARLKKSSAPKINLAGARTTQSSLYNPYKPDFAIDDNFSTYTHTAEEDLQPWWEISFPREYALKSIIVHNRADCCAERLSNILLTVYDSAGEILHESDLLNEADALQGPDSLSLEFPKSLSTMRVRVSRTKKLPDDKHGVLSIGEIEFFGPKDSSGGQK